LITTGTIKFAVAAGKQDDRLGSRPSTRRIEIAGSPGSSPSLLCAHLCWVPSLDGPGFVRMPLRARIPHRPLGQQNDGAATKMASRTNYVRKQAYHFIPAVTSCPKQPAARSLENAPLSGNNVSSATIWDFGPAGLAAQETL
jgi:hypothetical protein